VLTGAHIIHPVAIAAAESTGITAPVQRFQSGVVNDYVTWIVLGLAVIGGVLALIIR
jgi:hypothetical protein